MPALDPAFVDNPAPPTSCSASLTDGAVSARRVSCRCSASPRAPRIVTTFAALITLVALLVATSGCGDDDPTSDAAPDVATDVATQQDGDSGPITQDATPSDGANVDTGDSPPDSADATDDADVDTKPDPCPGSPGCPCDSDAPCDGDDDACTTDPICDEGYCTGPETVECDDGNSCTIDSCDFVKGCTASYTSTSCEDGDFCTYADGCTNGTCKAGPALPCDDGDICTDDACDPILACSHSHNAATCIDANVCIDASICDLGSCGGGKIVPCGDGNDCTVDRCSPELGCTIAPWPVVDDCPAGASHGDTCFFAIDHADPVTWTAARAACASQGGMLAAFDSRPAEEVARARAVAACGQVATWVGLDDRIRNNVWRWSDGSTLGWQNWSGGEPNNAGGEDVVQLVPDGGWNDIAAAAKADCALCMARMAPSCDGGPCKPLGGCVDGSCALLLGATVDCDDSDPCTSDACGKASCGHVALADGVSCTSDGGTCQGGACVMAVPAGALPTSCAAILAANASAPTGVYALSDGSGGSWLSHCDMATDGGGWTMVLRVDGKDADFAYSGKGWSDTAPLGADAAGPVGGSARLYGYATMPVNVVLLTLVDDGVSRSLQLPVAGTSLVSLVTSKTATATMLGAPAWRGLVAKPSLQPSCHLEGVQPNAGGKGQQVRIGILGNNENDCSSPDSWIGVGGDPGSCGKSGIVSGNVACYGANAKNDALARVYVR